MKESETISNAHGKEMTAAALCILDKLVSQRVVVVKTYDLISLAYKDGVLESCSIIGGAAGIHPSTVRKYKTWLAKHLKSKWN